MSVSLQQFDKLLADYYKHCGRNDYYDQYGVSKLLRYMYDNGFEEEHLEDNLGRDASSDECPFVDIDHNFPLYGDNKNSNAARDDKTCQIQQVFEVLQQCYLYSISLLNHIQSTPPCEFQSFQRIDWALMLYYQQCGIKHYFSSITEKGRFIEFVQENKCEEDEIDRYLGSDSKPEDCVYIRMDDKFPLSGVSDTDNDRDEQIFNVIKYCYVHGKPPTLTELKKQKKVFCLSCHLCKDNCIGIYFI